MHAIVCHEHGGPGSDVVQEILRAEPVAHAVLIKSAAIGVNYVDAMRLRGSVQPLLRRTRH